VEWSERPIDVLKKAVRAAACKTPESSTAKNLFQHRESLSDPDLSLIVPDPAL
jgi:hypothetical protein